MVTLRCKGLCIQNYHLLGYRMVYEAVSECWVLWDGVVGYSCNGSCWH